MKKIKQTLIPSARSFILLTLTSVLFGCSTTTPVIQRESTKPNLLLPSPGPINTLPVTWVVLTSENITSFFNKDNPATAYIALTPNGYKNLSSNQAEIIRYMQEQNVIIDAYKKYYTLPAEQK